MESKGFKKIFSEVAKSNGFESAFGGWFKDSAESIVVLDLQKSNFGDYYEMNIKIYIQGMFGNSYSRTKDLVKKDIGDVFTRQPSEYKSVFDFDEPMNSEKRKTELAKLFSKFIVPFAGKALSKSGIRELAEKGEIFLLPAVKEELG
ncbi:DUF4304 domain-containing protein [Sphingobacterium olei]|uniref:DUF4304 domain-containing protein n=1 Tax=Sphingobacterium olei TaxID=2571155 RepID=A0A4U0NHC2_9SPHI|nr:DUF4304 domain-containing protein [Sphingobacterium olei]TJZ53569.1 DUF4304 domain-containing protein [Sphingobacterium olei]